MFCTGCGAKLEENAKFCSFCGTPVLQTPSETQPSRVTPEEHRQEPPVAESAQPASFKAAMDSTKQKSRRRIPTIVLVALIMLLLSGIAYAAYSGYRYYTEHIQTPITTVETFTHAISEKDAKTVMECMDNTTRTRYETAFKAVDGTLGALGMSIDEGASQAFFEELVASLLPGVSDLVGTEYDYTVTLLDETQDINANTATVSCVWHLETQAGDDIQATDYPMTFNLELEWGTWHILYDDAFTQSIGI